MFKSKKSRYTRLLKDNNLFEKGLSVDDMERIVIENGLLIKDEPSKKPTKEKEDENGSNPFIEKELEEKKKSVEVEETDDKPTEKEEELEKKEEAPAPEVEPSKKGDGDTIPDNGGGTENPKVDIPTSPEEDQFKQLEDAVKASSEKSESKSEKPKEKIIEIKKKRQPRKTKSKDPEFRLEGYVILMIIDTIFPTAIVMINNMVNKKFKIESDEIGLSEDQYKKLEPLADNAADFISVKLNPVVGLFLMSTFMYGSNYMFIHSQKAVSTKKASSSANDTVKEKKTKRRRWF